MPYSTTDRTSLFVLSAHDRDDKNDTTSRFSIDIPSRVDCFRNLSAVQLISATIPNSAYNIDSYDLSRQDPTIELYYSGIPNIITIPRGQYVISTDRTSPADNDLLTVIETEFNTITGQTLTWSFDPVKNLLTMTASVGFLEIRNVNSYWELLGFNQIESPANSITAQTIPNLQGIPELFIHINELSSGASDLDNENGISLVASVLVDSPFGTYSHYQLGASLANLIRFTSPRNVSSLSVTLRDSKGRIVDLNDQDFTLVFRSYYSQ